MALLAFRMFPSSGIGALYREADGGGDIRDINAPRNRPALHPEDWLDHVYLHSALDNLEVEADEVVAVSHAQVNAGSVPAGQTVYFGWAAAAADHLLLTHDQGEVPFALVAHGDNIIWPGMPVQTDASGGARYVSVYCTTTGVYLHEWASIGSANLAATSLDYRVLLFTRPPDRSSDKLFEFDPTTGKTTFGRGGFDSSRRYLQIVDGGTPFGLARGRTIDLNNGAPAAWRPDGTVFAPVPSTLKTGLLATFMTSTVFGAAMNYGGAYAGPVSIEVQAP